MEGSENVPLGSLLISPAICPSVNVNSCERKQTVGLFTLLEQIEKVREKVLSPEMICDFTRDVCAYIF